MTTDLYTIQDLSIEFSVCERTIRRWVARGILKRVEITSRTIRYKILDLEKCRTVPDSSGQFRTPGTKKY